jgi:hypothetical protein
MTERRFTVRRTYQRQGGGRGMRAGWVVFDRRRPITIPFADFGEALQHRDNIAALYARWGW